MPDKRIVLEVAAFLDSSQAAALRGVPARDLRAIAEDLVAGCYDDLGREPWELDGQALEALLGQCLPARMGAKDPRARHVGATVEAWLAYLETNHVVSQSFELQRALDGALDSLRAAVAGGELAGTRAVAPADPFVHGAPKLGRNDPCSCGSGKKFKKCHGKNA